MQNTDVVDMLKLPKTITNTLSVRLSLMIVCEIALLLTVALIVMFHFSRQALREEAMHNAEQTLEGTAQHIDNILLSVEQSTGNVYWELLAHLDQPERMYDYSRIIMECNPYIVGCAIVFKPYFYPDRELFMAYVHRKGNSITTDEHSELVTQDTFTNRPYTEQVWYTQPMESGRASWTDPLKNEDTEGEALTTFCIPIFGKDMQPVGVVAVDLSIGLLSQIVLSAKPSENGYNTLMARNGSFIVHPDSEKLLHQTVFMQINHGADHSVLEAAEEMVAGKAGEKAFKMNGHRWHVFYKPFERAEVPGRSTEKLHWSIGVVYPEDDIFGEYNRLLYYLLAIAIVGLLTLFMLCRLITHRQLLPLNMLTYSAQRIAEGHYDKSVPNAQSEDEIGQLQNHFQQMQQSLAVQIGELEKMSVTLQERREVLQQAYDKAQEADRMKTSFLHYMTNQMTEPSDAIDKSVSAICDNYSNLSLKEVSKEVNDIQKQSHVIIDLLNHMLHAADSETGKEADHE